MTEHSYHAEPVLSMKWRIAAVVASFVGLVLIGWL